MYGNDTVWHETSKLNHIVELYRPSIQFVQQTKAARHNDFVTPGSDLQAENPWMTPPKFRWTQHATTLCGNVADLNTLIDAIIVVTWRKDANQISSRAVSSLEYCFRVFHHSPHPTWNFVQPVQIYGHVLTLRSGSVSCMQIAGRSSTTSCLIPPFAGQCQDHSL